MSTRALLTTGSLNLGTGSPTDLGDDIVLPADGPWNITSIFSTIVAIDDNGTLPIFGTLIFNSIEGDMKPDPAPGHFPYVTKLPQENLEKGLFAAPTVFHDVDWTAAGKATVRFQTWPILAADAIPVMLCGIIFGPDRPLSLPTLFNSHVRNEVSLTEETLIGTITLSERATQITSLYGEIIPATNVATSRALLASFRLDSDDITLQPSQWPFNFGCNVTINAKSGDGYVPPPRPIPVNIPVEAGARINIFAQLHTTGGDWVPYAAIYIGYR